MMRRERLGKRLGIETDKPAGGVAGPGGTSERGAARPPGGGGWRMAVTALILGLLLLPSGVDAGGTKPKPQASATAPQSAAAPSATTERAPDFVLRDLKGERFRLSDLKGKQPVLVIFSTTWCTYCKAEIPHFKKIHETYTKQGLVMVNIDIQESKEKVSKFTAQNQLPYRVLLDEDGVVSGIYDVRGVPAMVLIDKNGLIVCRQCRQVEPLIEAALKK